MFLTKFAVFHNLNHSTTYIVWYSGWMKIKVNLALRVSIHHLNHEIRKSIKYITWQKAKKIDIEKRDNEKLRHKKNQEKIGLSLTLNIFQLFRFANIFSTFKVFKTFLQLFHNSQFFHFFTCFGECLPFCKYRLNGKIFINIAQPSLISDIS